MTEPHEREARDLSALRASEEARRRVIGGAMARVESSQPLWMDALELPARSAPWLAAAATVLWIAISVFEPRSPAGAGPAVGTEPAEPAVLAAAWGVPGAAPAREGLSSEELLIRFAERVP